MNSVAGDSAPVGPQSARGKARLARMLAAATELFLRDGYEQTSIDAILVQSGGSKATLYAYFPTKEDLFRAVIDGVLVEPAPSRSSTRIATCARCSRKFAVDRLHVIFSSRHRAVLQVDHRRTRAVPGSRAARISSAGRSAATSCSSNIWRASGTADVLEVDDTEEAAEFFVGMLLHRWYKELLLLNAPTPSDEVLQRRAEHVAGRFLEAFHRRTH